MQLIKKIRLPSSRVSISLILDWTKILDLENDRELNQLTKVFCQRIDQANNDSRSIFVKTRLAKCEMMREVFGVILRKTIESGDQTEKYIANLGILDNGDKGGEKIRLMI